MSIVILTRSPRPNFFSVEFWKGLIKKLFGRSRGPQAVTASWVRGFTELGVEFKLNPSEREITANDVVLVNESLAALCWAISAKKHGRISHLFAGPNFVVLPSDAGGIMKDEVIEKFLFPSPWTRDLFIAKDSSFAGRIEICPAGVMVPKLKEVQKDVDCLLFVKNQDEYVTASAIEKELRKKGISYLRLDYGSFKQKEYFDCLDRCHFMVYLTYSESQGLALQEAWARNIPTYVWNRGYMEHSGEKWYAKKASAPLLDDLTGRFFSDLTEFNHGIMSFVSALYQFKPRQAVLDNYSDKVCASNLLNLIDYHE